MGDVNAETIRGWIVEAEAEVARLAEEAERIQQQLARARQQLALMYEMLASISNAATIIPPPGAGSGRSIREQVQANAAAILQEYGRPLRITDIHAEFVRRKFSLPGRGTPTNIAAHLVASNQFSRHGRGVYGLAERDGSAPPAEPKTLARPERTRRRGATGRPRTSSSARD